MPFYSLPSGASPVLSGDAAPTGGVGNVGDLFIDRTGRTLYGPKNAVSGWPTGITLEITGPTGPVSTVTGPTGATGASYTNVVTTPSLIPASATVTGYDPGAGDIYRLAVTGTTGAVIQGMGITGADGDAKLLINVGAAASITLNNATGPNANARFAVPGAGDYVLNPNGGAALIVYDLTSSVWRVI